jgi:hypothetical protein
VYSGNDTPPSVGMPWWRRVRRSADLKWPREFMAREGFTSSSMRKPEDSDWALDKEIIVRLECQCPLEHQLNLKLLKLYIVYKLFFKYTT